MQLAQHDPHATRTGLDVDRQAGETVIEGNCVLLRADGLRLLLPQADVGAVEHVEENLVADGESGLLRLAQGSSDRRYVYLSAAMKPVATPSSRRFMVTTIGPGPRELLWCWDELRVFIGRRFIMRPLPPVLLRPDAPVNRFTQIDGDIVFACTAKELLPFALHALLRKE